MQHRAQYRIGEPPERRVGRDPADEHVETGVPQPRAGRLRRLFRKVPAIAETADEQEAGFLQLERERRGGEHVPHHVAPIERDIRGVAVVGGEGEPCAGILARSLRELQLQTGCSRGGGIGEHLGQRPLRRHQRPVAGHGLPVVTERTTARECERQQGEGEDEEASAR
jgi:hypothetical protein